MSGLVPDGIQVPPGVDPMSYYLQLPAMSPDQAYEGADMTMTTSGPDQVWFLVVAIVCITVPTFFLSLRVYTRVTIVGGFELADCKYSTDCKRDQIADLSRLFISVICKFVLCSISATFI